MNSFFSPEDYSWTNDFCQNFDIIKAELLSVIDEPATLLPGKNWLAAHPSYVKKENDENIRWKTYEFMFFGIKRLDHIKSCPNTWNSLSKIPGLVTAQFSFLSPNTHVLPHKGFTKMVYRCHLPLIVPQQGDMGLRVENETRKWKEKELLIFDDSKEHEAWNFSTERRAVLMLDFARPDLPYTSAEICKYKIEKMDDPFLLNIATHEVWLKWLKQGYFDI